MVIKIKEDTNNKELKEIPEIKKYFSRIFSVFSKEVRDKLKSLNLSKKKKKILKKELAFLPEKKQITYIDEFYRIYSGSCEED